MINSKETQTNNIDNKEIKPIKKVQSNNMNYTVNLISYSRV